ncbi:MAG: class I SAM-dependent methyltransferase [Roseobacter sp.]|jgi:ubiquinone/menaquinone biosynthesis C-methylase UbiE
MGDKKLNVDNAYKVQTPEENRALYDAWAQTYDSGFAEAMDFLMPGHVARLFRELKGQGPVLDAGAGTGLVAAAIVGAGHPEIDALDISPEMLEVARSKGLYRKTIVADLTRALPIPDCAYKAVTSCGTFTHGHVGPEALDELLRVAAPGALFVLTIKKRSISKTGAFPGSSRATRTGSTDSRPSNSLFTEPPLIPRMRVIPP